MRFYDCLLVQIGFFAFLDFLIPSPIFLHLVFAVLMASLSDKKPSNATVTSKVADLASDIKDKAMELLPTDDTASKDQPVTHEKLGLKQEVLSHEDSVPAAGESTGSTPLEAENHGVENSSLSSSAPTEDKSSSQETSSAKTKELEPEMNGAGEAGKITETMTAEEAPEPVETAPELETIAEESVRKVEEAQAPRDATLNSGNTTQSEPSEAQDGSNAIEVAPASIREGDVGTNSTKLPLDGSTQDETTALNGDSHSKEHATKPEMNGNATYTNEDAAHTKGSAESNGQTAETKDTTPAAPRLPSNSLYQPDDDPGPTRFKYQTHPRTEEVVAETDAYFLDNWPFRNEDEKNYFVATDVNGWACACYCLAKDDRIVTACKVNTLLFLLDDYAEGMDIEPGKAFYKKLIGIAKGEVKPNEDDALERLTHELWQELRLKDNDLADEVLDAAILCQRAQVDPRRLNVTDVKILLEYRGEEGGVLFVATLMKWSMGLHLPASDFASIPHIFNCYSDVAMTANDILSFDKELRAWETEHKEGAVLLNMVDLFARDLALPYHVCKRVLWVLCREWELEFLRMVEERESAPGGCSEELRLYLQGLDHLLAGNEVWSWTTGRYHQLG